MLCRGGKILPLPILGFQLEFFNKKTLTSEKKPSLLTCAAYITQEKTQQRVTQSSSLEF